jgi:hypothetical protein
MQLYEYDIDAFELHMPLSNAGTFSRYYLSLKAHAEGGWRLVSIQEIANYNKDKWIILTFERPYVKPDWKP